MEACTGRADSRAETRQYFMELLCKADKVFPFSIIGVIKVRKDGQNRSERFRFL